jgi:hypothetical protein
MKSAARWFVAGGALFLLIGFLLPLISVSNPAKKALISPAQIAGVGYWFLLFLVPVFSLVILLLAVVPVNDEKVKKIFVAGQAGGVVLILILLLGSLSYVLIKKQILWDTSNLGSLLPPELLRGDLTIWPGIGFFILVLGMGIIVFGIITGFPMKSGKTAKDEADKNDEASAAPPSAEVAEPALKEAYLIRKSGDLSGGKIPIRVEDFSIGRRSDNDLQLRDKKDGRISRIHARIRYSQGSWYVQDQDSKIGTYVNEKRVKATRLKTDDTIKIGDEVFVFHTD